VLKKLRDFKGVTSLRLFTFDEEKNWLLLDWVTPVTKKSTKRDEPTLAEEPTCLNTLSHKLSCTSNHFSLIVEREHNYKITVSLTTLEAPSISNKKQISIMAEEEDFMEDDDMDMEDSDDDLEGDDDGVDDDDAEDMNEVPAPAPAPVEEDAAIARRRAIQAIMRDNTLSDQEKRMRIQNLMSGGRTEVAPPPTPVLPQPENNACVHYERNCNIVAPCCGKIFGCRICHDELSPPGHNPMNRFMIREVVCKQCGTRQAAS
jgi:hypothetical protein